MRHIKKPIVVQVYTLYVKWKTSEDLKLLSYTTKHDMILIRKGEEAANELIKMGYLTSSYELTPELTKLLEPEDVLQPSNSESA